MITVQLIVSFWPAVTGIGPVGVTVFAVMASNDCVADATEVENVEVLFPGILSETPGVTVAVLVIVVPEGNTGAVTFRTKFWLYPTARSEMVQVSTPAVGEPGQLQPPGFVKETNVVFDGTLILNVDTPAFCGPAFVTLAVIASPPPVVGTGSGVPLRLAPRSVAAKTVEVALALLLPIAGSPVLATVTLSVSTVPLAVVVATFVVTSIPAEAPARSVPVHTTVLPVVGQFHPAGALTDWNVVPDGIVSVIVIVPEVLGPLLYTVCEKMTLFPGATATGEA